MGSRKRDVRGDKVPYDALFQLSEGVYPLGVEDLDTCRRWMNTKINPKKKKTVSFGRLAALLCMYERKGGGGRGLDNWVKRERDILIPINKCMIASPYSVCSSDSSLPHSTSKKSQATHTVMGMVCNVSRA